MFYCQFIKKNNQLCSKLSPGKTYCWTHSHLHTLPKKIVKEECKEEWPTLEQVHIKIKDEGLYTHTKIRDYFKKSYNKDPSPYNKKLYYLCLSEHHMPLQIMHIRYIKSYKNMLNQIIFFLTKENYYHSYILCLQKKYDLI